MIIHSKIIAVGVVAIMIVAGVGVYFLLGNGDDGDSERALLEDQLQVYGNANGDWKVDADDVTYLQDIIDGDRVETKYADANNDGTIDNDDIVQVRALMDNTAANVWLVDGDGHDKTIGRDIDRIGCEYYSNTELMLILGMKSKVYAVDFAPYQAKNFYFGADSSVVNMGNMNAPSYEDIEDMDLDILLTFSYSNAESKQDHLTNVDVIYLGMYRPNVEDPTRSEYFQGILKAGYIFGVVDRAEAYMDWLLDIRDDLNSVTSSIPEADKKSVLMTNYTNSYLMTGVETSNWSVYTSIDPMVQACILAGGHPTAKDVLTAGQYSGGAARTTYSVSVAPEAMVALDGIDYAFCHCVKYTYAGTAVGGPEHGYAVSDPAQMNAAYTTASGRDLVDIDNIRIIAGDFRNGASGCMLLAAYMAKVLYPTLFETMDPLEYHQEYVEDWMGISGYDITTDGVFISPAITA